MAADQIYRCSDGHFYTAGTIKAMLTSLHFGMGNHFQRCPVDGKWRMAQTVNANELTDAQLAEAKAHQY